MIYVTGPFGLIFPVGTLWGVVLSVALLALFSAGWTMWLFRMFQFFRTQRDPAPDPTSSPDPWPGYPLLYDSDNDLTWDSRRHF